jgi:hypothetical protein
MSIKDLKDSMNRMGHAGGNSGNSSGLFTGDSGDILKRLSLLE